MIFRVNKIYESLVNYQKKNKQLFILLYCPTRLLLF